MLRFCCSNLLRKTRPFLNKRLVSLQRVNFCDGVRQDKLKAVIDRLNTNYRNKDGQKEEDEKTENVKDQNKNDVLWKSVKFSLNMIGITFGCLSGVLIYMLGRQQTTEDGELIPDEYTHLPVWQQYIYRTLRELNYYKRLIREPSRDKLLPDVVSYPYYQPPYTLVLELNDVLIHPEWTYDTGWRFKKRPGVDYLLESLHGIYEVVIYTDGQAMTIHPILNALDPKGYIAYKLSRDATHYVDGSHVKSLGKLNRDLSKVVVVDWNPENVKFHRENLLHLPRWNGNEDDTTLIDLVSFLQTIAQSEVSDVREVLKYYSEFENPLETFRIKQQQLLQLMEDQRLNKEKQSKPKLRIKF